MSMRIFLLLIVLFATPVTAASRGDECASFIQQLEVLNCPSALEVMVSFLTKQRDFFQSVGGEPFPGISRDVVALNEAFSKTRQTLQECLVRLEGDSDRPYAKALIDALISSGTVTGALQFWSEKENTRTPSPSLILEELDQLLNSVEQAIEFSST